MYTSHLSCQLASCWMIRGAGALGCAQELANCCVWLYNDYRERAPCDVRSIQGGDPVLDGTD